MERNVLVIATDENFDPKGYVMANPDLMVAIERDPNFDPRGHFDRWGKAERRKQLVRDRDRAGSEKFVRFQSVLLMQGYRFLHQQNAFPVVSDGIHLSRADYEAESSNSAPDFWTAEVRANPNGLYVDLGCGLRDLVFDNCLYIEVYPSASADIVMSPNTRLPLKEGSIDGLCCLAVLEHVENPFSVAHEIKRIVKPGGRIFIDWPFLQPVHGYPSHYYNATLEGLKRMFSDRFEIESAEPHSSQGADWTLSWILKWFLEGLDPGEAREKLLSMTVAELVTHQPQDELFRACLATMRADMRMKLACGNTLIGRRRVEEPQRKVGPGPTNDFAGS